MITFVPYRWLRWFPFTEYRSNLVPLLNSGLMRPYEPAINSSVIAIAPNKYVCFAAAAKAASARGREAPKPNRYY